MARLFEVHPDNPQPRSITQIVELIRDDALVVYPTDSCFALGVQLGNAHGLDRIRTIRELDAHHHFTLVCADFSQLAQFVHVSNHVFRLVKASTPGPYTFILPATREVPRRMLHPKKRTVGVRIPDNAVVQALLAELGEPLLSSTLLIPGDEDPMTQASEIEERIGQLVDVIVDSGGCGLDPTTVIDLSTDEPEVVRRGAGDVTLFD